MKIVKYIIIIYLWICDISINLVYIIYILNLIYLIISYLSKLINQSIIFGPDFIRLLIDFKYYIMKKKLSYHIFIIKLELYLMSF